MTSPTSPDLPGSLGSPLYLEDLSIGQTFSTRTYQIEAGAIKDFAAEFDPQWFHLDEEDAKDSFFGGLAASGWHTAAITMRLVVEAVPLARGVIGASGELQWPTPTRPGDILQATLEVLEITPSRSKPDRGMGTVRITTRNQRDEVVQTFRVKVLLWRRTA